MGIWKVAWDEGVDGTAVPLVLNLGIDRVLIVER
jgi:hypothetical protein